MDSKDENREDSFETTDESFVSPSTAYNITDHNKKEIYQKFNQCYQSLYRFREYATQRKIKHKDREKKLEYWKRIYSELNTDINHLIKDYQNAVTYRSYNTDLNLIEQKIQAYRKICKLKPDDVSTPIISHIHDQIKEDENPIKLIDHYIDELQFLTILYNRQLALYYLNGNLRSPRIGELIRIGNDLKLKLEHAIAFKKYLEDESPEKKNPPELNTYISEFNQKNGYIFSTNQYIGLNSEIATLLSNYYYFQKGLERLEKDLIHLIESRSYPKDSDKEAECYGLLESIRSKKIPSSDFEYSRNDDNLKLNAPAMKAVLTRLIEQYERILNPNIQETQTDFIDVPDEFRELDAVLEAEFEKRRTQMETNDPNKQAMTKNQTLIADQSGTPTNNLKASSKDDSSSIDAFLEDDLEYSNISESDNPFSAKFAGPEVSLEDFLPDELEEVKRKFSPSNPSTQDAVTSPEPMIPKPLREDEVTPPLHKPEIATGDQAENPPVTSFPVETLDDSSMEQSSHDSVFATPPSLIAEQADPSQLSLPRKSSPSPRLFEHEHSSTQNPFYNDVIHLAASIGLKNPRQNNQVITFDSIETLTQQHQSQSVHFRGSKEHWMVSGNHQSAMIDLASAITRSDRSHTTVVTIESQMRNETDYASMTQDLLALIQLTNQNIPVDTTNLQYLYNLTMDSDRVINRLVSAFRKDPTLQLTGNFETGVKTAIQLQFYIRHKLETADALLQEHRPNPSFKGQQYR